MSFVKTVKIMPSNLDIGAPLFPGKLQPNDFNYKHKYFDWVGVDKYKDGNKLGLRKRKAIALNMFEKEFLSPFLVSDKILAKHCQVKFYN